jgi:hypothetical protein
VRELEQIRKRWSALKQERSSWLDHWQDISEHLLPYNGRYLAGDDQSVRGNKRMNRIYDSTGTRALRTLSAGMMSGMTSPSRPWFRLSLTDQDLLKNHAVKQWLQSVTDMITDVLARSNAYRVLHGMYDELGAFGTATAFIGMDYDNVIHLHPMTVGEYCIATDFKGDVTTLYREFKKTVDELVREFGYNQCSQTVRNLYDKGTLDHWIECVHVIEPRKLRDMTRKDGKNMPWRSVYFETSCKDDKPLRESGFQSFPCVAPRWAVSSGDVYGYSPGMEALGDVKQLQQQQFRKSQAIDYQANPPLQVPSSMKHREIEIFPGGVNYYDATTGTQGIKTAFEVNLDLRNLLMDIQDVRQRINSTFFADVFMMITQQDTRMTATEVAERHEEKMLMLGPVVERLNNELLDPLVETIFERLLGANMLPPPPQELAGADLNVEYVSMLAQAQKAIAVNGVDRFVMNLGQLATIKPDVLDKFDADHWADMYSDKLGIDPQLIIGGKEVAMIRQQRAQAMQAQQQQEAMQQMGSMAKDLSSVDLDANNPVSKVINSFKR